MPHEITLDEAGFLPAPLQDLRRAIGALGEQLRLLDGLHERHARCTDPELRLVLSCQRDNATRQAVMLMEWLRRHDSKLAKDMREILFKAGPIAAQFHYD